MRTALCGAVALLMTACATEADRSPDAVKVEVVRTANGCQLLRGGVPYTVRGAGMEVDDLAGSAASGGNSIRNWTTEDRSWRVQALLGEAHAHGVTVALCLAMKPERAKFDCETRGRLPGSSIDCGGTSSGIATIPRRCSGSSATS